MRDPLLTPPAASGHQVDATQRISATSPGPCTADEARPGEGDLLQQRAALRDRAMMNGGLGPFDSPHSLKEKISPICGHSFDGSCIDQVCQIISRCSKKCCGPCKERCNEMVIEVLRIVAESTLTKLQNSDNTQAPTVSDTVLVSVNEEVSKASAGSDGNKPFFCEKPCVVSLDTPCVKIPLADPPVSKSIPAHVHPLNRRSPFARRDKLGNFPQTSLYSPKGLFDLHISDSECDVQDQIANERSEPFSVHVPSVLVTASLKETNPNVHVPVTIANSQPYIVTNSEGPPYSIAKPIGALVISPTAKTERAEGCHLADIGPTGATDGLCQPVQLGAQHPMPRDTKFLSQFGNVASDITNFTTRKRVRDLGSGGFVTGCSRNVAVNGQAYLNVQNEEEQLDCVPPGEAKGNYMQLADSLIMPGALSSVLSQPHAFSKKQRYTSIGSVIEATSNSSNRSRSAVLLDQIYNSRNVFVKESQPGVTASVNDPIAVDTCKPNVSTTQNLSEADVNHIGGNWIEVQKQSVRFPLTIVHLRFYYILTGLGHSQWKDLVAVRFSKTTTVTWESFSLSIEPERHYDNFFVAGFCRKNFEDSHPRKSRKHFFYPKVGHSLMAYNSQYEIDCVRTSFLGANSALKLHLADKLYFSICHLNHWFLFVVDIKSRCFVFLDSYFSEGDLYQQEVMQQLLKVFKVVWLLYAENKTSLNDFRTLYPPIPKQETISWSCGTTMLI